MYSVYIPHVSMTQTQEFIAEVFRLNGLGSVTRVDFVPQNTINANKTQQAFVHFYPVPSDIIHKILLDHRNGQGFKLTLQQSNEYWILCKNNNPIPETKLNIHQIVANMQYLEKVVGELVQKVDKIPQLEEDIATLSRRIQYLEEPEWLSEQPVQPLHINDLSLDDDYSFATDETESANGDVRYSPVQPVFDRDLSKFSRDLSTEFATMTPVDVSVCHDDDEYDMEEFEGF